MLQLLCLAKARTLSAWPFSVHPSEGSIQYCTKKLRGIRTIVVILTLLWCSTQHDGVVDYWNVVGQVRLCWL